MSPILPSAGPVAGRPAGTARDVTRCLAACLAALWLLAPAIAGAAGAQAGAESGTVRVVVVDPTAQNAAAEASAVILYGTGPDQPVLAQTGRVDGEADLGAIRLEPDRTYLVRVTAGGVDYWAEPTGADLLAGPLTVQVFPTATAPTAASIDQMSLVLRRTETDLLIEAMLTVGNTGSPARTVVPSPASLELAWPAAATGTEIQLLSVPDAPVAAPVAAASGRIGLPVVLRPGISRIRVSGRLPYDGRAEVPVGSDLAIAGWSVLGLPPDLEVQAPDLELGAGEVDEATGGLRHEGPPLAAGQGGQLLVSGGTVAEVAPVTGQAAGSSGGSAAAADQTHEKGSAGFLWLLALLAVGLAYVIMRRRR